MGNVGMHPGGWALHGLSPAPDFPICAEETVLVLLDSRAISGPGAALADQVLEAVRALSRPNLTRLVYHDPSLTPETARDRAGTGFSSTPQPDGDAGARFEHAFFRAFRNGARRVLALSANCVGVTPEILAEAFDALGAGGDAALGPSQDGDYYLVCLARPCRQVFRGIPWRTDRVLWETLARLRGCGFNLRILPPLRLVRGPEDLEPLRG